MRSTTDSPVSKNVTTYVLDVNVLLPLLNPEHEGSDRAHVWLENVRRFATTPITESGVIRLLMNPKTGGVGFEEAQRLVRGIFSDSRAIFFPDMGTLREPRLSLSGIKGFRQVTDFQLLNLAALHGAVLATFDAKLSNAVDIDDRHLVEVIT